MYKWAFFVRLIWVIFSIGKSGPFFFSCGLQIYFVYLSFIHWPVSDYLSFSSSVLSIILRKKKEKKWLESSDTFIFSLFVLRTFESCSARTEQKITLVSSSATSSNSFSFQCSRSIVVWKMQLHLPRSHDKPCSQNKKSIGQANQTHSEKFEKTGIMTSFPDMATRVTCEKYASRFPDVVIVSILRVF